MYGDRQTNKHADRQTHQYHESTRPKGRANWKLPIWQKVPCFFNTWTRKSFCALAINLLLWAGLEETGNKDSENTYWFKIFLGIFHFAFSALATLRHIPRQCVMHQAGTHITLSLKVICLPGSFEKPKLTKCEVWNMRNSHYPYIQEN